MPTPAPMPMIDTHCHLDVPAFADDVDDVVARATTAGVVGMLVPAIRPSTWPALAALVARHRAAGLRLAIGIHPQIVPDLATGEIGGRHEPSGRSSQAPGQRLDESERTSSSNDRADESERAHASQRLERDAAAAIDIDIDAVAAWIAREAVTYRAVAIGECGLDGATGDMPRQEALFRAHIRAAHITGLPLVIHVLRAHDAAPRILREELARPRPTALARDVRGADSENLGPYPVSRHDDDVAFGARDGATAAEQGAAGARDVRGADSENLRPSPVSRVVGVMHSYSGGADLVDVYRELGLAFSFAGPVSYANARKPVEAARVVPAELLLAETDAPDQAPEGHRGGRSEPAFVAAVIAGLAAARGVAAEEIAALTTANAQRIFGAWSDSAVAPESPPRSPPRSGTPR